ncbi:MAG TPA: hypothetical protein GXX36_14025 [Clostridiaceae bacterium]|nr:hypothetical protein [Clostridiaceae bacterium]
MLIKNRMMFISICCLMIFLFSSLGTSVSFAAGPEYENVALNKPVSIPEWDTPRQPPYAPENAVDGIGGVWTNGWEPSKGDGVKPWLQIDLLDEYVIHRIEIDDRPYDGKEGRPEWEAPRKDFEIRASNDPTFETYVVLGSTEGEPFEIPTWVHYVTDTNAYRYIRYVRLYEGWTFLSEIRVYGSKPGEDFTPPTWSEGSEITVSDISETGVTLTWPAATDENEVTEYKIYKNDKLLDTVAGSVLSYNVTGLIAEMEYAFRVEAIDAAGNESTNGPVVTITTLPSSTQFTIQEPVFKDALGNVLERLVSSIDLRASITITNNFNSQGNACFMLALYGPDKTFENFAYIQATLDAKQIYIFNAGFTLPSDIEGYYIKAFVWDSMEEMQPLSNTVIFE